VTLPLGQGRWCAGGDGAARLGGMFWVFGSAPKKYIFLKVNLARAARPLNNPSLPDVVDGRAPEPSCAGVVL
jgi:hypothetical protein